MLYLRYLAIIKRLIYLLFITKNKSSYLGDTFSRKVRYRQEEVKHQGKHKRFKKRVDYG